MCSPSKQLLSNLTIFTNARTLWPHHHAHPFLIISVHVHSPLTMTTLSTLLSRLWALPCKRWFIPSTKNLSISTVNSTIMAPNLSTQLFSVSLTSPGWFIIMDTMHSMWFHWSDSTIKSTFLGMDSLVFPTATTLSYRTLPTTTQHQSPQWNSSKFFSPYGNPTLRPQMG